MIRKLLAEVYLRSGDTRHGSASQSAPRDFAISRFVVLHTPVTSAPKYLASCTAYVPNSHLTPNKNHDIIAPIVTESDVDLARESKMARQKEFDQDVALDQAMTLFWQKGYEATSIQDLVDCMGIGRRSLYDTFKSKHELFIAALDRYRDLAYESTASFDEPLVSPRAAIQEIFEGIVAEAVADRNRKGCFVVNSAVELAGQDEAVTIRSRSGFQAMEFIFHSLLHQAQEAGEVGPDHDIQALAQYLTNAIFGIRVMSKMNPDRQVLTNVVNLTLSILD